MAQEYDNTNRGSIWKNDRKSSDSQPDFNGTLNVDGVEYWVSAWKRKPGASEKAPALSFSIQAKEEQPRREARQPAQSKPESNQPKSSGFDDMDEMIPF